MFCHHFSSAKCRHTFSRSTSCSYAKDLFFLYSLLSIVVIMHKKEHSF